MGLFITWLINLHTNSANEQFSADESFIHVLYSQSKSFTSHMI